MSLRLACMTGVLTITTRSLMLAGDCIAVEIPGRCSDGAPANVQ